MTNKGEMILGIFLVLLGKELLIMDVFLLPPADYFAGQEEAAFDTLDTHRRLLIVDCGLWFKDLVSPVSSSNLQSQM